MEVHHSDVLVRSEAAKADKIFSGYHQAMMDRVMFPLTNWHF
jgi:hypothetical protein